MTLLGRATLRAGLTPVMDQTQSLAGGSDGQGGVGEQADGAMPTGADRSESLGGAMGGIIQTGGVLQRQNDAVRAQPFQGGVLMALQDLLRFYGLIFKKPISGFPRSSGSRTTVIWGPSVGSSAYTRRHPSLVLKATERTSRKSRSLKRAAFVVKGSQFGKSGSGRFSPNPNISLKKSAIVFSAPYHRGR